MTSDLLALAMDASRFALYFVLAFFLPVILQVLLLFVLGRLFTRLMIQAFQGIALFLALIGTPIHELSHALACLLTLSGVRAIKLLPGGTPPTGQVTPARDVRTIAPIIIALAPLAGATTFLWLTARYVIPGFEVPTIPLPQFDLQGTTLRPFLVETMDYAGRLVQIGWGSLRNLDWTNWRTYLGLYIALSISIEVTPSPGDIKVLSKGLLPSLLAIWGLSILLYALGNPDQVFVWAQTHLVPHLLALSTAVAYALVLVSVGLLGFVPLYLLNARNR